MYYTAKEIARFWSHVVIAGENECWNWTGSLQPKGYGQVRLQRKTRRTSRVAWEIKYGAIPDDLFVLHKCDNRACCNPAHLFLGTNTDNMRDMMQKGRKVIGVGEQNPHSKLTWDDVFRIRTLANQHVNPHILAKEYNVTTANIRAIVSRKTWKDR